MVNKFDNRILRVDSEKVKETTNRIFKVGNRWILFNLIELVHSFGLR